ncbi:polyprotein [Macaca fascicularis picornavirus]|nr:polyprotein [Macaca fascicularis picornavirus]
MGTTSSKPDVHGANFSGNSGVVNLNYYLDTYTNSVDLAKKGSTNPSETSGWFPSILKAGSNLLGGLLQNPKVENEVHMPDRLQSIIIGNTQVLSQASVGTAHGYPGTTSMPSSSCADEPTTDTPFVSRSYMFPLTDWSSTAAAFDCLVYPLPLCFSLDRWGGFGDMLKRHWCYKNDWIVQIQCNASAFHQGCLLVAMVPDCVLTEERGFEPISNWQAMNHVMYTPEHMTVFPHQLLNLRTNTSCTINVPFVSCMSSAVTSRSCPWTLVIMVISPLNFATGSSPVVPITATFTPYNCYFNGLRYPELTVEAGVETFPRESAGNFTSSLASSKSLPAYGPGISPNKSFVPGEVTNLLQVTSIPSFVNCNVRSNILSYTPFFSVSNQISMTPYLVVDITLSSENLSGTLLGSVSKAYCQYRGSLDFFFLFTGTQMMKGRFLISYMPPTVAKPSTVEEAMLGTYTIWDIGLDSTLHFKVPFISCTDFRYTKVSEESVTNLDGWLTVWAVTTLTYPAGSPNHANIVVLAASGSDFCFRNPCDTYFVQGQENLETGVAEPSPVNEDIAGHPLSVYYKHTDIQWLFDRSCFFEYIKPQSEFHQLVMRTLDPLDGVSPGNSLSDFQHWSAWRYLLGGFTYMYSDLTLTVEMVEISKVWGVEEAEKGQLLDVPSYSIRWLPSGSVTTFKEHKVRYFTDKLGYTTMSTLGRPSTSFCPMQSSQGRACSISVPYTSVLNVLPLTYCGKPFYNDSDDFGVPPGRNFGSYAVLSRSESLVGDNSNSIFCTYLRFNKMRVWCPRGFPRETPDGTQSHKKYKTDEKSSTYGLLNHFRLLTSGDVEQNPGPTLSKFLSVATIGIKAYEKYNEILNKIEEITEDQVNQAAKFLLKLIVGLILCIKNRDVFTLGCVALMLGIDFTPASLLNKIYSLFNSFFSGNDDCEYVKYKVQPKFRLANAFKSLIRKFESEDDKDSGCSCGSQCTNPFCEEFSSLNLENSICGSKLSSFNMFLLSTRNLAWLIKELKKLWDCALNACFPKPTDELDKYLPRLGPAIKVVSRQMGGAPSDLSYEEAMAVIQCTHDLALERGMIGLANYTDLYLQSRNSACTARLEPVVLVIRGSPGCGKSVAAQLIAEAVSVALCGNKSVYSFPPDCKHMDGYQNQLCMIMDDLGQNPDGEDFRLFCQMVSTTVLIPSMASLTQKGTHFNSEIIIATTNCPEFAPRTITDSAALKRRITIDVTAVAGRSYVTQKNTLDLQRAMQKESSCDTYFRYACPLTTGSAVKFVSNTCDSIWSLEELVGIVLMAHASRVQVLDVLSDFVLQADDMIVELAFMDFLMKHHDLEVVRAFSRHRDNVIEMKAEAYDELQKRANWKAKIFDCLSIGVMFGAFLLLLASFVLLCKDCLQSEPEPVQQSVYDGSTKTKTPTPRNAVTIKVDDLKTENHEFESSVHKKNTFPILFCRHDGVVLSTLTGLGLCGPYIMMNKHGIESSSWDYMLMCKHVVSRDDYVVHYFDVGTGISDAVIIKLNRPWRMFRDITPYFTNEPPRSGVPVVGLVNSENNQNLVFCGEFRNSVPLLKAKDVPLPCCGTYVARTKSGYCGAPIIVLKSGKPVILGIHSAGNGIYGVCSLVTKTMLQSVLKVVESQACITYVDESVPLYTPSKTQLCKTELFYKDPDCVSLAPAVLSEKDKRCCVDLFTAVLSKHEPVIDVAPSVWKLAALVYSSQVFGRIGTCDMWPVKVAIQGTDWVDPMRMDTSPGYPYVKQNRRRTDLIVDGEPIPELMSKIYHMLSGDYSDLVFVDFLKDELRPLEKVSTGRTRIISIPCLEHVIVGRMLMGAVMEGFLINKGLGIGSAVGIDPEIDWTWLYAEFAQCTYVWCFDYSGFDSSHSPEMFSVLSECFFRQDCTPDVSKYLRSLSVTKHYFLNKTYFSEGGLPSGVACTTLLNTIINNVLFRAALFELYPDITMNDFKFIAYGDDSILGVNFELDVNAFVALFKQWGYRITPARKDGHFSSDLKDATFLKRSFKPNCDGLVEPVMDFKHLYDHMCYARPGCLQQKIESVSILACHLTCDEYDEIFSIFRERGYFVPTYQAQRAIWRHLNGREV